MQIYIYIYIHYVYLSIHACVMHLESMSKSSFQRLRRTHFGLASCPRHVRRRSGGVGCHGATGLAGRAAQRGELQDVAPLWAVMDVYSDFMGIYSDL